MLICASNHADANSQTSDDVVDFFKRAITSPPDIEEFTASSRTVRERFSPKLALNLKHLTNTAPVTQHYRGARAGSDFYLEYMSSPERMVAGRLGAKAYNVGSNAVYFGFERFDHQNPTASDRISQASESAFQLTSQFCHMGLGDINPGSITWSGNEFTGANSRGVTFHGHLELSNNLPSKVTLRWQKTDSPFKVVLYSYPDAIWSLSGFPAKATVLVLFGDGLQPFLELNYLHVRLAKDAIPSEHFEPARFLTTNTAFTNVWGKDTFTSISPMGTSAVSLAAINRALGVKQPVPWRRRIIFGCFVILTLMIPISLLWIRRTTKKPITQLKA